MLKKAYPFYFGELLRTHAPGFAALPDSNDRNLSQSIGLRHVSSKKKTMSAIGNTWHR